MFSRSLSDFATLVTQAVADGAPSAPEGPVQSLPLALSKDGAINKFQGAVFKLASPGAQHPSRGLAARGNTNRAASAREQGTEPRAEWRQIWQ